MSTKTKSKRAPKAKHASRTDIMDMIHNTNGRICTITYKTKDGNTRVMNCNRQNAPLTKLGYLLVNDMQEKKENKTKTVDPRTIMEFKFRNKIFRPND